MDNVQVIEMPVFLHYAPQQGRKPTSIPDTTQFSGVTRRLFGVPCATPDQAYHISNNNELYLLHLHVPVHLRDYIPAKVLARVSTDAKVRSDMSMESEIATMVFVRSKTDIPVPIVYGYCPSRENAIGQPFSIISFAEGEIMNSSIWEDLSLDSKLRTIRDYAKIILELSKLKFDRIGSLYFTAGVTPSHSYRLGPVAWCKPESGSRRKHGPYDRGPWKVSANWLRASLSDEINFMEKMPQLAQSAYKCRTSDDKRWRLAQKVLPKLRDWVADTIDDPLDRCRLGPFVLSHMNLNPRNIIFAREGGHILCVLDWEMSLTVPLWALVCYPSWFGQVCPTSCKRNSWETQAFKDTYIRELQRLTPEPSILSVVQNPRSEAKRRFAEVATLPWPNAHYMLDWMNENTRKR